MSLEAVNRRLIASPAARALLLPLRLAMSVRLIWAYARVVVSWLARSREHTNFTYAITSRSERHLAWFVARIAEVPVQQVEALQRELWADSDLRAQIQVAASVSPRRGSIDPDPLYGRRVAWYTLVRLLKPQIVVEAGVDKGLGTLVLAAALLRNTAEGSPGQVIGMDINPAAGSLIGGQYAEVIDLRHGDSVALLRDITDVVDIFIHDSNHDHDHESAELRAVFLHMSKRGLLLSDASADSDALDDFCRETHLPFAFAAEQVAGHWMTPQGVGVGLLGRQG